MTWRTLRRDSAVGQTIATVAGVLVSLILFGFLVYATGQLLDRYIQPTNSTQKKDLVQALGFIVAGAAGAVGIFFTWRNLRQEKDKQITERFTRAIDQLGAEDENGNKKLEVRVGGMYALEQIAKESRNLRDPIIEVLSAYIRKNSSTWPTTMLYQEEAFRPWNALLHRLPDIQTALTVLGRTHDSYPIDLSLTDLRTGNLSDSNFENAIFDEARLEGATLKPARREGRLKFLRPERKLNFRKVSFMDAHLEGAVFQRIDLEGANFERAHLHGTNFTHCTLEKVEGLTQDQINEAIGDKKTTILPKELKTPEWWDEKLFNQNDEIFDKKERRPSGECPLKISTKEFVLHASVKDIGWRFRTINLDRLVLRRGHSWLSIHEEPRVFDLKRIALDVRPVREAGEEKRSRELEHHYLIKEPKAPDEIVSWFKEFRQPDDFVEIVDVNESKDKVSVGDDEGVMQLDVTVQDIPENFPISSPALTVPIFHSRDGRPFFLSSGHKNRIVILNVEGKTRIIVLESPHNEFDSFFLEAQELLKGCKIETRNRTDNGRKSVEIAVPLEDRPAKYTKVVTPLESSNINILDLRIRHPNTERAAIVLTLDAAVAEEACNLLREEGFVAELLS